jgi:hypothetical protein
MKGFMADIEADSADVIELQESPKKSVRVEDEK